MKVNFTYTGGRERSMPEAHAKVLQKLGRGSYMTRDMVAAPQPAPAQEPPAPPAAAPVPSEPTTTPEPTAAPRALITTPQGDFDLTDMEKDDLHELAEKLGVEVHHASGAPRVRAALLEAFSA